MNTFRFRALWPITDHTQPFLDLIAEAKADLPAVAARAHARPLRGGRWSIAPSAEIPGSGRITPYVLVYDAPASPSRQNAIHQPIHHNTEEQAA